MSAGAAEHESDSDDQWITTQCALVSQYLAKESLTHNGVTAEPEWCVIPYVALWTVGSIRAPGSVGWWAVSGDVPTDYISAAGHADGRSALRAIIARWKLSADDMAHGRVNVDYSIGLPEDWPSLAPLLESRAAMLQI